MRDRTDRAPRKGVSLAKGPAALVGLAMIAYGVLAFIFGATNFGAHPLHGTVNGDHFLGLEVNGWDAVLFAAGGALLLFGSPMHWGAKAMSIMVGGVLGACALIALDDGQDVYGVLATNWLTKLVWAALAAGLLLIALLPRVGRRDGRVADERDLAYRRDRDGVTDERTAYGDRDHHHVGAAAPVAAGAAGYAAGRHHDHDGDGMADERADYAQRRPTLRERLFGRKRDESYGRNAGYGQQPGYDQQPGYEGSREGVVEHDTPSTAPRTPGTAPTNRS